MPQSLSLDLATSSGAAAAIAEANDAMRSAMRAGGDSGDLLNVRGTGILANELSKREMRREAILTKATNNSAIAESENDFAKMNKPGTPGYDPNKDPKLNTATIDGKIQEPPPPSEPLANVDFNNILGGLTQSFGGLFGKGEAKV